MTSRVIFGKTLGMTLNMTLRVTSTSEPTVNSRVVSFCLKNVSIIDSAGHGNTDEDADDDDGDDEDDDDDLSGGGDEADCVEARSSSWYQGSRSVTFHDYRDHVPHLCPLPSAQKITAFK